MHLDADGSIDSAFGTDGILRLGEVGGYEYYNGIIDAGDGKTIGDTGTTGIARLNADGTPDLQFGMTGRIPNDPDVQTTGLARAGATRIVVLGYADAEVGDTAQTVLRRYWL